MIFADNHPNVNCVRVARNLGSLLSSVAPPVMSSFPTRNYAKQSGPSTPSNVEHVSSPLRCRISSHETGDENRKNDRLVGVTLS